MSADLTGQVAVISGASGRLGPLWAQALRDAGATVVLLDRAGAWEGSKDFVPCDITDAYQVTYAADLICEVYGPPAILVNNAGVDSRPSMTDYDQMASDMAAVNVLGTDRMIRAFAPMMAAANLGAIINIASLYGLVSPDLRYYDHRPDGWVKDPMYGATKAGVISLTRYYAAKFGPRNVRVNALAPGGVVADGDGLTAQDPQFVQKYTSRIPMGRMCQPSDLAGPLVFLASEAASFVTGQVIALDGGYLCW